jgi:hypothetical protein
VELGKDRRRFGEIPEEDIDPAEVMAGSVRDECMVARLEVPFEVLGDQELELTRALRLPTFEFGGATLLKRLTLVISERRIEKFFYPVFPPDQYAMEVIRFADLPSRLERPTIRRETPAPAPGR